MKRLLALLILALFPVTAKAYTITNYLEMVKVSNVGNAWVNLTLENTYTNPVVACTYNLPSSASTEGSARVQVVGSNVQVRVQRPLNGTATISDVYCTVSEKGSYITPIKYEAHLVESTRTNRNGSWNGNRMVNVTASKVQNYTNPVVTGQVMSNNDPNYVTFWSSNCTQGVVATNAIVCVGKHTGESDIDAEFTETLGYFIAEEAEYTLVNAHVKIALGPNTIRGVDANTPPFNYTLPRSYTYATATIAAMNGGDGGWAVLFGANPISSVLSLAIDEDTVRNAERNHIAEEVSYWVMEPIEHPELSLQKTVSTIYDPINGTTNPKSIPGAVLEYTLSGENSGDGPADNNSIVLNDVIPTNTKICVANIANCITPSFSDGTPSSGLNLASTTYSTDGTTFSASSSADAEGADASITHLRTSLGGSFAAQTGATAPSFDIRFRVIVE